MSKITAKGFTVSFNTTDCKIRNAAGNIVAIDENINCRQLINHLKPLVITIQDANMLGTGDLDIEI